MWIAKPEVLAIHDRQLIEHGGAPGIRDVNLLASALARPQQLFAYGTPDILDLAAAYTAGIVRNHPFLDGNKRTGFVVGILFLELNGYTFTAPEPDAAQTVLALAAGELTEEAFAVWLRDYSV
jgi:death-on-curing protein